MDFDLFAVLGFVIAVVGAFLFIAWLALPFAFLGDESASTKLSDWEFAYNLLLYALVTITIVLFVVIVSLLTSDEHPPPEDPAQWEQDHRGWMVVKRILRKHG
jgi:hypothetical protein